VASGSKGDTLRLNALPSHTGLTELITGAAGGLGSFSVIVDIVLETQPESVVTLILL
jgi:hypothetical protein